MPRSRLRHIALAPRSVQIIAGAAAVLGLAVCSDQQSALPTPAASTVLAPSVEARARIEAIRVYVPGFVGAFAGRPAPAIRFRLGADGMIQVALPPASPGERSARVEIPVRAAAPMRLIDDTSGISVEFTLNGTSDTELTPADGLALRPGAAPGGGDLLHRVDRRGVEDLIYYERTPGQEELRYRVDVTRVAGLRLVAGTLELLDPGGAPRLRVSPPYVLDASGARAAATLSVEGCSIDESPAAPWRRPVTPPGAAECVVKVAWDGVGVRYPAVVDPTWELTDGMIATRIRPTATLLDEADPKSLVLIAGGFSTTNSGSSALASAELYEPLTRTFSATGSMNTARGGHTATLVQTSGGPRVFLAGGSATFSSAGLESTELFSPGNQPPFGSFSNGPSLDPTPDADPDNAGRRDHTATRLQDGRVLLAGGTTTLNITPLNTFVVYDPQTNILGTLGTLARRRRAHAAVLLGDGRVLISGGFINATSASQSMEIYDPAQGTSSETGVPTMIGDRAFHSATLLEASASPPVVLVAGGVNAVPGTGNFAYQSTAEVITLGTPPQVQLLGMGTARAQHTATRLPSGDVVVAGGVNANGPLAAVNIYVTQQHAFTLSTTMTHARQLHAAVLAGSGNSIEESWSALVFGGFGGASDNSGAATAEILIKGPGDACTTGEECLSGFCADGVCCDEPCIADCYACVQDLKEDGGASGTCGPAKINTPVSINCIDETNVEVHNVCDGLGHVIQSDETHPCAPGTCGSGERCVTYCYTDDTCASNAWCDKSSMQGGGGAGGSGAMGTGGSGGDAGEGSGTGGGSPIPPGAGLCQIKGGLGAQCSGDNQCLSGYCADSVCCTTACTGPCHACNLPSTPGACTLVGSDDDPEPTPEGHPVCGGEGKCEGQCTGKLDATCTYPGSDVTYGDATCACTDANCAGGALLTRLPCQGNGEYAPKTERCGGNPDGGFRCADERSCKTSCTLETTDDDCIPDFICQNNVCVDLAIVGPTCDGKHTVHVVGPDDIDCTPYPCEGNACRTSCKTVDDCVSPYACNRAGKCVTRPVLPDPANCSCRLPGGARNDASCWALALATLGAAAAHRRRARRLKSSKGGSFPT